MVPHKALDGNTSSLDPRVTPPLHQAGWKYPCQAWWGYAPSPLGWMEGWGYLLPSKGWGDLLVGLDGGTPSPRDGAEQRILARQGVVCLLCSRRRTFLLPLFLLNQFSHWFLFITLVDFYVICKVRGMQQVCMHNSSMLFFHFLIMSQILYPQTSSLTSVSVTPKNIYLFKEKLNFVTKQKLNFCPQLKYIEMS